MTVIKTKFNFTYRLSQISELYCSLLHLHTSIYHTLAFLPLETDNTSLDATSTSSNYTIMTLDTVRTPQMSRLPFVLRYLSRFISIKVFGVLNNDLTLAIRCLPNRARFAQSGYLFRFYTRAGYLPPIGYIM